MTKLDPIKFDENFNRVIFIEKIFISQKIRDLKYHKKTIFLMVMFNWIYLWSCLTGYIKSNPN